MSKGIVLAASIAAILSGCAMSSNVMDAGNGTYMISAHAAPIRGGAAGANDVAYSAANDFCVQKGGHAVVIGDNVRDVYQGAFSGSSRGFSGGVFAAGNADLRFRCELGPV